MIVTEPVGAGGLTFRGDANGEVPPIRIIQGPKTGLGAGCHGVDPVNNE